MSVRGGDSRDGTIVGASDSRSADRTARPIDDAPANLECLTNDDLEREVFFGESPERRAAEDAMRCDLEVPRSFAEGVEAKPPARIRTRLVLVTVGRRRLAHADLEISERLARAVDESPFDQLAAPDHPLSLGRFGVDV